ncbi:MAG: hypothetical protein H6733_16465 [Alphaproteobacteria bacterium]|nr:hypothetical protein [Alphaproteobacteria bacterium]
MRTLILPLLLATACTSEPNTSAVNPDGSRNTDDPEGPGPEPWDAAVDAVIVEVDYEPAAEPATGSGLGGDPWDLFDANAAALFAGTGVTVTAPHTLAQMGELPTLGEDTFTASRLIELSDAWRDTLSDAHTSVVHVLYLDGRFEDDGQVQDQVIGVSIGDTGVVAMFGPVLDQLGLLPVTKRFGEQATLIHEFGHAMGLVDNGVDATTAHVDTAHGAHCTNDRCVMYWANEGASDMADFVSQYITTGSEVLFDDACLDDMAAAHGVTE